MLGRPQQVKLRKEFDGEKAPIDNLILYSKQERKKEERKQKTEMEKETEVKIHVL